MTVEDKIDGMAGDITDIKVLQAQIYENLKHQERSIAKGEEALEKHKADHQDLAKHVSTMVNTFDHKIMEQTRRAKHMGYIGTMIGGAVTFIAMHFKKLTDIILP